MTPALPPYPATQETGIPWLGQVPAHWEFERAKTLFVKKQRLVRDEDDVVTCFRDGTVTLRKNRRTTGFTESIKEIGYQGVRKGDLVIHIMDAAAGAMGVSDSEGKCTPVYIVATPEDGINTQYYAHLMREMARQKWIDALAKGIRERSVDFRYDTFGKQFLCVPPEDEQAAIARYLDWADSRIRRLIHARQQQIKLLEEYKQVIIQQAVTGQVDVSTGKPYPAYKDSGVAWLGQVPEHWRITRIKNEFSCLNNIRVPLSSTERGKMKARLYDYYGASGVIDKVDDYLFDDELLLIAEDGANLVLRNLPLAIIARGKFWVNNHAHILKPKRGSIRFLANIMETLNYSPWISGAAQPKLTKDRLLNISICVPAPKDQEKIMQWLDKQTKPINIELSSLKESIELLKEYRTRLIADVVTGKVDVRQAAAQLPAVEEELQEGWEADEVEDEEDFEEADDAQQDE